MISVKKKQVVIIGLYMPGIYPTGEDNVIFHLLAPLQLKVMADTDPIVSKMYDVTILDLATTLEPCEIARQILSYEPDIVAYSLYMWNDKEFIESSNILKQIDPSVKMILGGPQVSYNPIENLERNPQADVVVSGAGESRFVQLLNCKLDPREMSDIPQITFRDENRQIVSTGGTFKEDVTKIPSPYQNNSVDLYDGRQHTVLYETYRGCPFKCSYCIWGDMETKLDLFPIEQVLNDMELLYNNPNVRLVYFADACVFYTRERAKLIIDKIASCKYQHPTLMALDILQMNEEMAGCLKKVNFHENAIHFGLQSTDSNTLDMSGRRADPPIFRKNIATLRRVYPDAELSFDIIHGLPGDNYEKYRETINFGLSMEPRKLYFSNLILLPGTSYWDDREKHEFTYGAIPPYVVSGNNTFPVKEVEKSRELYMWVQLVLFFYPIRDIIYEIAKLRPNQQHIELVEEFADYVLTRYGFNPFEGVNPNILTIEANNIARRRVFNRLEDPRNCLIAYKAALDILHLEKEDWVDNSGGLKKIRLGIEFYEAMLDRPEAEVEKEFLEKYDKNQAKYIKCKWIPSAIPEIAADVALA